MEIKALFGILSVIFTLFGVTFYLISIYRKESNPHLLSWLGWAFITLIGALAMLDSGSTWATLFIFANSSSCFIIVIYSLYKKIGIWSTTFYDYIFFSLGILGIILWQVLSLPLVAIILSVVADLLFAIPTITKVYKYPKSENYVAWIPYSVAGIFGLLAVSTWVLSEVLYPVYVCCLNILILLIILLLRNKTKISE